MSVRDTIIRRLVTTIIHRFNRLERERIELNEFVMRLSEEERSGIRKLMTFLDHHGRDRNRYRDKPMKTAANPRNWVSDGSAVTQ